MNAAATINRPSESGREMPKSIEAEQALIGAVLINNDAWRACVGLVEVSDFAEPVHAALWRVIDGLCQRGVVTNPVTVGPYIADIDFGGVNARQYVARLTSEATSVINAPDYARMVRDLAVRRKLIGAAQTLLETAYDAGPEATAETLISDALSSIDELRPPSLRLGKTRSMVGDLVAEAIETAELLSTGERIGEGITTGLPALDDAIGGFHPGELVIVSGRPGMGKSTLATSLALSCSKLGHARGGRALFISRELSKSAIASRLASDAAFDAGARIAHSDIRKGRLGLGDIDALRRAETVVSQSRLIVEYAAGATLREIESIIQTENKRLARSGEKLDVVFVDQLKQVKASDRYKGQRVYEIGEITWGLREMARRHRFCCVLMCQVNRALEGRDVKNKRPSLGELRESGDIENDADVVMFVYREAYYLKRQIEAGGDREKIADARDIFERIKNEMEVIVSKNRHGDTQTVKAFCDIAASAVRPLRDLTGGW